MGLNPKLIFQLAILFLTLVIFVGIYILKRRLPFGWKSKEANKDMTWSLGIALFVFLAIFLAVIIITN